VGPDVTLVVAAREMRDHAIGDVLVVEDGRLRGILTDRDIVVRAVAEDLSPCDTKVAEVYSRDLTHVSPEDDAEEAVRLMRARAVRRIPVVERGRPVGMVSIGDLAMRRDPRAALADISSAPGNG
jgi:CBS domain-containing protein